MTAEADDSDLCRLLYTSRLPERRQESQGLVYARIIAEDAALRNQDVGITGVLLFLDGQFIQVLEGPQDIVEATFERICRDSRHQNLQLIDMVSVDERMFDEWSMATLGIDPEERLAHEKELDEIRYLVSVNAAEATLHMRTLIQEGVGASSKVTRLKPSLTA